MLTKQPDEGRGPYTISQSQVNIIVDKERYERAALIMRGLGHYDIARDIDRRASTYKDKTSDELVGRREAPQ